MGRGGRSFGVECAAAPGAEWFGLAVGGAPSAPQRDVLDPGGRLPAAFLLARDVDGEAVGQLRAAVVADHLHLSMAGVVAAARRRGIATALVAAATAWGRGQGTRWGVLQVALQNVGARALYDRLGWVEHHRYRYRVPPPD